MICVTGAGGTLGSEVVRLLRSRGVRFRAAYFSPHRAAAARAEGLDAVVADYRQPDTVRTALRGCDVMFLLGPNTEDQTALELAVVDAARSSGVTHVVKQSVMGAEDDDFSLGRVHRPVELGIESSGMTWTFLRPNSFMQNVVTFMGASIRAESVFYSASGLGRVSHIDVRDVAEVAVAALTGRGHEGKAYTLTGLEALTYDQMADELSRALGRTIGHVSLAPSELRGALMAEGLSAELADRMLDLERYFREQRAAGVTADVRQVTGREPRAFTEYARDCAAMLQPV